MAKNKTLPLPSRCNYPWSTPASAAIDVGSMMMIAYTHRDGMPYLLEVDVFIQKTSKWPWKRFAKRAY